MNVGAQSILQRVGQAVVAGEYKHAIKLLRRVQSSKTATPLDQERAKLALVQVYFLKNNLAQAGRVLDSLKLNILADHPDLLGEVYKLRAQFAAMDGRKDEQLEALKVAQSRFQSSGDLKNALKLLGQSVEVLQTLQKYDEARLLIEQALEQFGAQLASEELAIFQLQALQFEYLATPSPETEARVEEKFAAVDQAEFLSVAIVMRIYWGRALLEHQNPPRAIQVLDRAREDAVRAFNPVLYIMAASCLAQAYEYNDQRPEAYGTLLRASHSLRDVLGPEGAQLPDFLMEQLEARWTKDVFDGVVETFHSQYDVQG